MKKVKITVMKTACYKDLIEEYENPMEHTWDSISAFVMTLAHKG